MRSSRGPDGTFSITKWPSLPVRVPTLMPAIETSAPATGSPVATEMTFPWTVPVCAPSGTARRKRNDATIAARTVRTLGRKEDARPVIGRSCSLVTTVAELGEHMAGNRYRRARLCLGNGTRWGTCQGYAPGRIRTSDQQLRRRNRLALANARKRSINDLAAFGAPRRGPTTAALLQILLQ